jgi:hypothetical protein
MSSSTNGPFGTFEITMRDGMLPPIQYDRLALGPGQTVMLLSFVCGSTLARAVRAVMSQADRGTCLAMAGGRVKKPDDEDYYLRQPGNCYPSRAGYQWHNHRLDYHQFHVMAISKDDQFMPVVNDVALWWVLKQTKFTTPLDRSWAPWLEATLRDHGDLEDCACFNCRCAVLTANSARLDGLVASGLSDGCITIPEPPALWVERAAERARQYRALREAGA